MVRNRVETHPVKVSSCHDMVLRTQGVDRRLKLGAINTFGFRMSQYHERLHSVLPVNSRGLCVRHVAERTSLMTHSTKLVRMPPKSAKIISPQRRFGCAKGTPAGPHRLSAMSVFDHTCWPGVCSRSDLRSSPALPASLATTQCLRIRTFLLFLPPPGRAHPPGVTQRFSR